MHHRNSSGRLHVAFIRHRKPAASQPADAYDLSVLDEEGLRTLEGILTKAAKAKMEKPGPKDE